jgi:predicted ATPase/DNA-binding SARP family transcriptional activator
MNAQRDPQRAPAVGLRRVDFGVLGPLEAYADRELLGLGPPKQRALLTQLLVRANEAVPVERLIDELWPEDPPASARHAVQVYVSRLRDALGDRERIVAQTRSYRLRAEPEEVDLARFRALLAEGKSVSNKEPERAAELLREALALWRGRALADLDGEAGVRDVVLELEELKQEGLELLMDAELAAGKSSELIPEIERLIAEYPAAERLRTQLMLALYCSGRQQDALDAYQRAREALLHELGLEPSPKLKQLEQAILRQDPSLIVEPAELRARKHLPAQPNAFIGRERELEALVELVASGGVRLVTLTGTGGIGKTRLAIAAAERLAASFRDGVWFVDVAPLSNHALVVPTIAQTLGVAAAPGETLEGALADHLRDRELLLLADNFEHVLQAATALSALLREAPRLKLFVTSRRSLRLYGEHEFEVPALELPEIGGAPEGAVLERCESVALFLARARAVRPKFNLASRTAEIVAETCVRLDGLPLAIELAAARLRTLSPDELHRQLASRFDLLSTGLRDVPARHQTMRATIEWSYELLDGHAKQLFAGLSVFAGTFSREAAQEVCEADGKWLAALVDLNLLKPIGGDRFLMLETIREFAADLAKSENDRAVLRRRHAEYYRVLVEAAEPQLEAGPDQRSWLDALESERDNLRLAIEYWRTSDEPETELRFVSASWRFWWLHGYVAEVRRALDHALTRVSEPEAREPGALEAASYLAYLQGDFERADRMARELEAAGRRAADAVATARGLHPRAVIALQRGDFTNARMLEQEAAHLLGGDPYARYVHQGLASLALMQGDSAEARAQLIAANEAATRVADSDTITAVLTLLSYALLDERKYVKAVETLKEATVVATRLGDRVTLAARCAPAFADVLAARGEAVRAAKLVGAARSERERLGVAIGPNGRRIEERALSRAREDVDANALEHALEDGRRTPFWVALDDVLAS